MSSTEWGRSLVLDAVGATEAAAIAAWKLAGRGDEKAADQAVDRELVQRRAHRVDRGLVGGLLVAAAGQLPGGDGGDLGDADRVQHQAAVQIVRTHVPLRSPN